ncbi:MAG: type IV toxin-antitoxin system AbiEi family antitoxin [Gammaproteobacteria bacterium]
MPLKETSLLLTYFAKKGWLSRIWRGLYIVVPLGTINPKEYISNPWIIAKHVFAPCYIGGWSAAEHWDFTEQIFNSVMIISTQRQRKKKTKIHGIEFVVKSISKKYFGKTNSIWIDNVKVLISDPIQTIVDMIDDPYLGGGMRNVADIIKEYFISKYRNDLKIIEYINKKQNKTIYKRLGYLIEVTAIDAPELKNICQQNISTGFSLLDPTIKTSGKYDSSWNLIINVRIKK